MVCIHEVPVPKPCTDSYRPKVRHVTMRSALQAQGLAAPGGACALDTGMGCRGDQGRCKCGAACPLSTLWPLATPYQV